MVSAGERVVFIPDAHLNNPDDENFGAMVRFLDSLKSEVDTLIIMGDFFEFWMGYKLLIPFKFAPLLGSLHELTSSGVKIHYTEGNHDFFMGPAFIDLLGAEVHPGPWEFEHCGLKVYVAHGDQVNKKDYGYRFLRWLLRSPPIKLIRLLTPTSILDWLARKMSKKSQSIVKNRDDDEEAIIRDFSQERFKEGYDAVVMGHFHKAEIREEQFEDTDGVHKGVYVNVGRWMGGRYDYVVLEDGKFSRGKEFRAPMK